MLIALLILTLPRFFTIGFSLQNSSPARTSETVIPGPLSRSIVPFTGSSLFRAPPPPPSQQHRQQQRRADDNSNVMKIMMITEKDDDTTQQIQMIHCYESPFFPINDDHDQNAAPTSSSALIILNTPIKHPPRRKNENENDAPPTEQTNGATVVSGVVLGALWKKSAYRVCADGGANRLYEVTADDSTRRRCDDGDDDFLPDLITGDLDSLYPHVRDYYEKKGVEIVRVEDQDFHDLDKSLMAIEKWIQRKKQHDSTDVSNAETTIQSRIFIYGGFGGRFDQEMAVINALCVWGKKESFRQTTLAVYDEQTCAFLLAPMPTINHIRIRYPGKDVDETTQSIQVVGEGPTCGLIPIFGRCERVYTTGLQWNLNGDVPIEFGGLVSSSNRVIEDVVVVKTSSPMLFTAEIIVSIDA